MSPTLNKEDELAFFRKAKELVRPGRLFRFVTSVYADRKLLVFLWIHCVCTLVVWGESISACEPVLFMHARYILPLLSNRFILSPTLLSAKVTLQ